MQESCEPRQRPGDRWRLLVMGMLEGSVDADALLAQGAWLRRLAAALVSDPAEAEDLAQETWLVALRAPPRSAATVRLWLRQVFVSRLRDARRARQRRGAREQAATNTEQSVDDPEWLAARMELHRRVASHMASLDEPIRQVLFLRFVEGLEPVEVARRLGIPGGTARWRLKRGLDELRERLDADSAGERQRWLPLLLPLLLRDPATRPARGPRTGPVFAGMTSLRRWGGAAAKLALGALVLFGLFGAWQACTALRSREVNSAVSRSIARESSIGRRSRWRRRPRRAGPFRRPPSCRPRAAAPRLRRSRRSATRSPPPQRRCAIRRCSSSSRLATPRRRGAWDRWWTRTSRASASVDTPSNAAAWLAGSSWSCRSPS